MLRTNNKKNQIKVIYLNMLEQPNIQLYDTYGRLSENSKVESLN